MIARIWRRLRGTRQSPARVALAVALGLFIGCLPLYGVHVFLCALVCLPFGLDFVLAYAVANISNPFLAPFLITLEVEVGSLLLEGRHAGFTLAQAKHTGVLGFVWQASVGSVLVGAVLGALGSGVAYVVARQRQSALPDAAREDDDPAQAAIERTLARYAPAQRADRFQVAGKLYWDPLSKLLASLPRDLGRVLDAGAGRGQFGLLLLELGACQSLRGFDLDAHKLQVAQLAASGAAHYEQRDLLELPSDGVDTLLLFDVLHYLPIEEQDALLERAARLVTRRILIRELDASGGTRSLLTRLGEWLAERTGLHGGRAGRHYRPASVLLAQLTGAGFSCTVLGASAGTPFANVLIVAERSSGSA